MSLLDRRYQLVRIRDHIKARLSLGHYGQFGGQKYIALTKELGDVEFELTRIDALLVEGVKQQ